MQKKIVLTLVFAMLGADGGINLHMNSNTSSHVSPSKEMALFRLVHFSLPFRWHFFHIFSMNLCCMSPLMLVLDWWKRQHRGCFLATSGWQFAEFFCFFVHIRFCWQLNEHGCSNLCSNIALVKTHAIWLNVVATREHTSFGTIWHIEKTSKNSIVWTLNLSISPQMRRWCKMEDGFPWETRRLNETLGVSDGFSGPGERFPERLLWGCEGVPSCRHGELMGNSWGTGGTYDLRWNVKLPWPGAGRFLFFSVDLMTNFVCRTKFCVTGSVSKDSIGHFSKVKHAFYLIAKMARHVGSSVCFENLEPREFHQTIFLTGTKQPE